MTRTMPVLIDGEWRPAEAVGEIRPVSPATGEPTGEVYPVSGPGDVEAACLAGARAWEELSHSGPEARASFLERFAARIEARRAELVARASLETALPAKPRLDDVELPRTTGQLRQAARAARDRSWTDPTIDTKTNIRSMSIGLPGPVVVIGPNNFPFAFNGAAGGDFAAAIAAGCPVIAKAHPSHPGTTRILAEEALEAARETGLPRAVVQLVYHMAPDVGERLVSHPAVAATAYTGSRRSGLVLKAAADRAGKPIYLEMSSVNPVVVMPGALEERLDKLAQEYASSCLMGTGQFCTNPGLVVLLAGPRADAFVSTVKELFEKAPAGTLLSGAVLGSLTASVATLREAGAELLCGGSPAPGPGFRFQNTLLAVDGKRFLASPAAFQTEAFGNAALVVTAGDAAEARAVLASLEGNLTGTLCTATGGEDDRLYALLAPVLRHRVGRLLENKMPTGVAVVPSMGHGGPYPAASHPGFTSVGLPASLARFAMRACYDGIRDDRLPVELRDRNAPGRPWRLVDGEWTKEDLGPSNGPR